MHGRSNYAYVEPQPGSLVWNISIAVIIMNTRRSLILGSPVSFLSYRSCTLDSLSFFSVLRSRLLMLYVSSRRSTRLPLTVITDFCFFSSVLATSFRYPRGQSSNSFNTKSCICTLPSYLSINLGTPWQTTVQGASPAPSLVDRIDKPSGLLLTH